MDLRFTLKAVRSLQSFSEDIQDEVTLYGDLLGQPVEIPSPSPELLQKIDALLLGMMNDLSQGSENIDYPVGADYSVGELGDD